MSAPAPRRTPPRSRAELPDGLPRPRRWWAVLTVMAQLIITVLDSTMVNVALPNIAESLNTSPSHIVRVVIAYNITVVVTLLPFSAVAERLGFRRLFGIGVGVFGLASFGSSQAGSLEMLLICRIAQGLGASMLMCMFGGLVRNIYPLRHLAMGLSLNASVVGITAVLGPTIGAWILALASWPWIFLVNLPICVVSYLGIRFLPEVPRVPARFDWLAALLTLPAFGLAILGLDILGHRPLTAVICLVLSALAARQLLRRSRRQRAPLVPVDLLRITAIGYAVAASLMLFAAQMAALVSLPFFFDRVLHYSYGEIGLVLGAWSLGTAGMAPLAAYFSSRYSVAVLCAIGGCGVAAAMLGILLLPLDAAFLWFFLSLLLGGIGFGFFQTPNNRAMLAGAPRNRSGAAGAMQATTRVFGQGVGTGLVAMVFALGGELGPQLGIGVSMGCALVAVGVNIARHRNPVADPELQ
ncbi:MAG: MFS transporter [Castellaniella sp.]